MLVALAPPADNQRGPRYLEQALNALHSANRRRSFVTLEFGSHAHAVGLYCRFPSELQETIEGQLTTLYPGLTLTRLPDALMEPPADYRRKEVRLRLAPDVFPLRSHRDFEDLLSREAVDPMASILQPLTPGNTAELHTRIELTVRPSRRWRRPLARCRLAWRARFPTVMRDVRPQDIQAARDKLGRQLFDVRLTLVVLAPRRLRREAKTQIERHGRAFCAVYRSASTHVPHCRQTIDVSA